MKTILLLALASAFGQVSEIPAVKAPVGTPQIVGPVSVPGASLGGSALGNAPVVSLANTLPQPLIVSPAASATPLRAAPVAGSDKAQPLAGAAGSPQAPAASPAEAHAHRFQSYVKDIMGKRVPTEAEMRVLLESYLEERGVPTESQLAEAIEAKFFAPPEPVSPRFAPYAPGLRKLAKEHGVPVARLEALADQSGLLKVLAGPEEAEYLFRALDQSLTAEKVRESVAHYPRTAQGEAMRTLASNVTARSGKSVEELARAGAFMYVNFHGRRVHGTSSGRDPDVSSCDVVFYATIKNGRWKIEVYRQNRRSGVGGSDASYQAALKEWLIAGGLTEDDFE